MPNANIVEIYYMLDEVSKLFDAALQAHGLKLGRGGARRRASLMSDAEVMTILVLFHTSGCRTLKAFYLGWVCTHGRADFPRVLSYSRFAARQQQVLPKLLLFLRICALGRCTGVSIVDSTRWRPATPSARGSTAPCGAWRRTAGALWAGCMGSSCTSLSTRRGRLSRPCSPRPTPTAGPRWPARPSPRSSSAGWSAIRGTSRGPSPSGSWRRESGWSPGLNGA